MSHAVTLGFEGENYTVFVGKVTLTDDHVCLDGLTPVQTPQAIRDEVRFCSTERTVTIHPEDEVDVNTVAPHEELPAEPDVQQ